MTTANQRQRKRSIQQVEETAFGKEGDPKKVARTIRVDMSDTMRFTPADITVKRGETVKFIAANRGRSCTRWSRHAG